MDYKVSVSGLGKAGLPLVAVIAESGIPVIGIDVNETVVNQVNAGNPPFEGEPGLKELLTKHKGKNVIATTNVAQAIKDTNAHIVIVPLFIDDNKQCDFSILDEAFTSIGKNLKKEDIIILETTVPPKTTETRIKEILEKNSNMVAGVDFYLAYSPERIMTGYSISRFSEFPKVIGGINQISTDKAYELYSKFGNMKKVTDARTAELVKVSEGLYRDVNIALANEILKVCDNYCVNFWEMREAASHQFCNIHEPGSVGGHCIPVYPWFIINNMEVPLIKKARLLNDEMIKYYADKVDKITKGKGKVGVIGITYREGVKELAYTRSIPFMNELKNRTYEVYAFDILMNKKEIEELNINYLEQKKFDEMDAIVLLNREKSMVENLKQFKEKLIDVKNTLNLL
jgi:UDP-N-acetyl-D-mannosaminuronic acid dehydrogenase